MRACVRGHLYPCSGPALRANTLVMWANVLLTNGGHDEAVNTVWPLIEHDLEWVTQNWENQPQGCDLWEEVHHLCPQCSPVLVTV